MRAVLILTVPFVGLKLIENMTRMFNVRVVVVVRIRSVQVCQRWLTVKCCRIIPTLGDWSCTGYDRDKVPESFVESRREIAEEDHSHSPIVDAVKSPALKSPTTDFRCNSIGQSAEVEMIISKIDALAKISRKSVTVSKQL